MKVSNRSNQSIYRVWAPVYDFVFEWFFAPGRNRAHQVLDLKTGESLLIVGIGTGSDLPLVTGWTGVVGIDLSWAMLKQAQKKASRLERQPLLVMADAQRLPFADAQFEAATMNLVLSVVPDGRQAFREAMRVLCAEGRVVIFDKFLSEYSSLTLARKVLNGVTRLLGTDINRRLGEIIRDANCEVVLDEPVALRGAYRVILIERE